MELFINSTFAQSVRGHRLMWLASDGRFYDVTSREMLGEDLFDFFSEDLFKAIWYDKTEPQTGVLYSYLGAKRLWGNFNNGKNGVIDIAVRLAGEETALSEDIALPVLGSLNSFSDLLFRFVSVDAAGDYSLDFEHFIEAFRQLPACDALPFVNTDSYPDMLHTAVCMGSMSRAYGQLSAKKLQYSQINIIDINRLENYR